MVDATQGLRIAILDGYTLNPGDLSWDDFYPLGQVDLYPASSGPEAIARGQSAHALIVNKVIVDESLINQCPNLQYIGVTATGYNNVDVDYAVSKNITVCNVPVYGTASVAQMVFAHILNHACQFTPHVNSVRQGDWSRSENFCYTVASLTELQGKTLGIVGLGRTGTQTAEIATAFGMTAIAYHYKPVTSPYEQVSLHQLFSRSDYVSLHVPLTATTQSLVNRDLLALMPSHSVLINTARGGLIHESDLADALNSGQIAGAGLDVLSQEPPHPDNPLLTAKNCFITPHIAWITKEARQRLLQQSCENLKAWINSTPLNAVGKH